MTNTSTSCEPLSLAPAGKDYLWGGTRLNTEFHKGLPLSPLAETWECSTHPDGPCLVAAGPLAGRTLAELLGQNPQWLGSHPAQSGLPGLPILVKLIDAKQDLSVQVHPDDAYALSHEGQLGKTEMWYVVDAQPGARLVYGFAGPMTPQRLRRAAGSDALMRYLQFVPVHKGDVFFIRPGTVHAIGGGVLVAEIQESSNVTYRVYDYDRRDKAGQLRPLHLEQALDVLDLGASPPVRQPQRVFRYSPGCAQELLCRCRYFQVERVLCSQAWQTRVEQNSFQVLLALEGSGRLQAGTQTLPLPRGQCVFLPAGLGRVQVQGALSFLRIQC